jgi:hypothetical protein
LPAFPRRCYGYEGCTDGWLPGQVNTPSPTSSVSCTYIDSIHYTCTQIYNGITSYDKCYTENGLLYTGRCTMTTSTSGYAYFSDSQTCVECYNTG